MENSGRLAHARSDVPEMRRFGKAVVSPLLEQGHAEFLFVCAIAMIVSDHLLHKVVEKQENQNVRERTSAPFVFRLSSTQRGGEQSHTCWDISVQVQAVTPPGR